MAEIHWVRKGIWAFLCAFRVLIGWAGKLITWYNDKHLLILG